MNVFETQIIHKIIQYCYSVGKIKIIIIWYYNHFYLHFRFVQRLYIIVYLYVIYDRIEEYRRLRTYFTLDDLPGRYTWNNII